MTLRYSVEMRNASIDAKIGTIGPRPVLKIFGAPAPFANDQPGKVLVSIALRNRWMTKAKDGAATSVGPWQAKAAAGGKANSFVIYDNGGTPHIEGSIPEDLKLEPSLDIAAGHNVTISSFTIKAGNSPAKVPGR